MATEHNWKGYDKDFNNGASWDSGQVPGAGGVSTDTFTFDGAVQTDCMLNLDRSAGNPLLRGVTMQAYKGNIGTPDSPLIVEFSSTTKFESRIIHRGQGRVCFKADSGGFSDALCDSVNLVDAMRADGTLRKVYCKRGALTIKATATIAQEIIVSGSEAKVYIEAGVSPPTHNRIYSGRAENHATLAASQYLLVEGGTWIQYGVMAAASFVFVAAGGNLIYAPNAAVSSQGPHIVCNGIIDLGMTQRKIYWDNIILGPSATVYGGAPDVHGGLRQAAAPSTSATKIDLREEYP